MKTHVRLLGVLYLAFSILGISAALIIFMILASVGLITGDMKAAAVISIVGSAIALFLVILAIPGIIGGIGLLKCRPWARIFVIVLGCLNLLHIPIGTILGIYTLWVLLNDETIRLFDSIT